MSQLSQINSASSYAERSLRICQGVAAASVLFGFPAGRGLGQLAFRGRIAILSLELFKDLYGLTPWTGEEDKLFPDLREGRVCTLKNGAHFSVLMVDLATFGLFLTDILGLAPQNRVSNLLNQLSDPFLVTFYLINLYTETDSTQSTTLALDLLLCLAPYLLSKGSDKVLPAILIVSGAFGLYATSRS